MKYRIGRKQKRVVLDDKGHEVAIFQKGREAEAKIICDMLNNNLYEFRNSDYDGLIYSSLHKSKKGAYKAMNKYLNDRFNEKRTEALCHGTNEHVNSIYDHIFGGESYKIYEVKVLD